MSRKRRKIELLNSEFEYKPKPKYDYETMITQLYKENQLFKRKILELEENQHNILNGVVRQNLLNKNLEELIFNIDKALKNISDKVTKLENNKPLPSYIN